MPVKGPPQRVWVQAGMWLKGLLLYVGGERGTIVPHALPTLADAILLDGWRTFVAALSTMVCTTPNVSFFIASAGEAAAA
jgi:hypothetical protein